MEPRMTSTLPSKKEVLLNLLEKASVLVHLDARREDVKVPRHLKTNPQLILQLGLNLAVPIQDLDVSDDQVTCTLSFARTPFFCVLPYPAIFAMVAEDGKSAMVWPEDVPAEVARQAEAEARKLGLIKPDEQAPKPLPPRIEVGTGSKRTREESPKGQPEKVKPPPKTKQPQAEASAGKRKRAPKRELPPYLRVIK
jgi:stringent starvation protein B